MAQVAHKEFYTHATVVAVDLNIDVEKYGGGSYKGSRVTYRNLEGEIRDQSVQQGHLDRVQQAQLKGDFANTKSGDKITFYKARMVNEGDEGLSIEEAKEKYRFISLLRIYEGHIIPPEIQNTNNAPLANIVQAAAVAAAPKDHAGMLTGHALTCASHLLTPAKAKDKNVLESAAVAIAELTADLLLSQPTIAGIFSSPFYFLF